MAFSSRESWVSIFGLGFLLALLCCIVSLLLLPFEIEYPGTERTILSAFTLLCAGAVCYIYLQQLFVLRLWYGVVIGAVWTLITASAAYGLAWITDGTSWRDFLVHQAYGHAGIILGCILCSFFCMALEQRRKMAAENLRSNPAYFRKR
jgi:hypothetical protein